MTQASRTDRGVHCAGCVEWVSHSTHDEGYACPGLPVRTHAALVERVEGLPWVEDEYLTDGDTPEHGYVKRAAVLAILTAAEPAGPMPDSEAFDEAGNMCPNCVTPWKCNGPHLADQTKAAKVSR
jgi:hypothetical protein